jgi:hypothetical protein
MIIPFCTKMTTHWLLRVGDGIHFERSSKKGIWGVDSKKPNIPGFLRTVKKGDLLWFVKTGGLLIAVATYTSSVERVLGPLITLTQTNEELGWTEVDGDWDTEVHFDTFYNISLCELNAGIKSPLTVRTYNDKCKVDLPTEYKNILRYSKLKTSM